MTSGSVICAPTGENTALEARALRFEEPGMSQPLHFAVPAADLRSPAADALFRQARGMLLTGAAVGCPDGPGAQGSART